MRVFVVVWSALIVFAIGCWIGNASKMLWGDDWNFTKDSRAEVAHTVGLVVPPASLITVWFDDVKDAE